MRHRRCGDQPLVLVCRVRVPMPSRFSLEASMKRRTLTVAEAAVCLGISRNTAYEAIRRGTVPSIRLGRRILIPTHALEILLSVDGPEKRSEEVSA